MTAADLVVRGQVVVEARPDGLEMAEAVAIHRGRVVSAGAWSDIRDLVGARTRVVDERDRAVVPGMHDFHLHLAALARRAREVRLDDVSEPDELLGRVVAATAHAAPGTWVAGRGWADAVMVAAHERLAAAVGVRTAYLASHDGHSAWASPGALRLAGIDRGTDDPPGGRIERDGRGDPTGVLRETALDLVARHVPRLQGPDLREPLRETVRTLAGLGITAVCDAGDYTAEKGFGRDADLGDSHSTLADLGDELDGRLRVTLGIPAEAIAAASGRGRRTGEALPGRETVRFGWAKVYADGALGSGTAALLAPSTCGRRDAGILRVGADAIGRTVAEGRRAGIGVAVHAIGDRAVREVLDGFAGVPLAPRGAPRDRIEHAQLVHADDVARFAELGIVASVQPIHAAADRDLVETCWGGRQDAAYPWRRLAEHGVLVAAGSDAPIEDVDPWVGVFAAVHRRLPGDRRPDWRPGQALRAAEAIAAWTTGPAAALGITDEGSLRPGARADLAVLTIGLETLLAASDELGATRSVLTLMGGGETHAA